MRRWVAYLVSRRIKGIALRGRFMGFWLRLSLRMWLARRARKLAQWSAR